MDDPLKKGAWIASTKKHLDRHQCTAEVYEFSATEMAGKAANLLALLQADAQERVKPDALNAYYVAAKVRPAERDTILRKLAEDGRIEVCKTSKGDFDGVDVYTFSRDQVLQSASRIFDRSDPTQREVASLQGLELVAKLPRTESDLLARLAAAGFKDRDAALAVQLQQTLGLVGVDSNPGVGEKVIFNEHAFMAPGRVVAACKNLSTTDRTALEDVQNVVETSGCATYESLAASFPPAVLTMMEGLGLIDRQEVVSPHGNSEFVTLPQTFGLYGGQVGMGVDCFHHAKMLICCIKYGELRSKAGRGRISNPVAIVNSLLSGREIGPCTAIGQDYTVLEREGVIALRRAHHRSGEQFYMRLRKREVGELAKQVLLFSRTLDDAGLAAVPPPSATDDYVNPQVKRASIVAAPTGPVAEVRTRLLATLRT